MKTIQIFAADHRKDIQWEYPFIRVTDNSGTPINFTSDKLLYENKDSLSELAKMLYVYKNINDFGNPDYIGFYHYRRFFANISSKLPWLVSSDENLKNNIYSSSDQLQLILNLKLDGIIENSCYEVIYKEIDNINDWFKRINKELDYLQISEELIDFSIDQFYSNIDNNLKPYFKQSYRFLDIYHHNIFIFNRELFNLYFKTLNISVENILEFEKIQNFDKTKYSKRWFGYIIEYLYTNVFIHAIQLSGKYNLLKQKILEISKK